MKALLLLLLLNPFTGLFLLPVNAVITSQVPTPITTITQYIHSPLNQFGQDKGTNTLQATSKAFSFYRPGGNISIGAVTLVIGSSNIPLSNSSNGLFPQGLSNSTVIEYLYDQSVFISPNTYHGHAEIYIKTITNSYNREIIYKASGDINGLGQSNMKLLIQFSNPQSLSVSQCDNTPQPGLNGNTFLCNQQSFGNMGISFTCSTSNNLISSSYNNQTLTETYNINNNFFCDPLALDGSGKAGTCALTTSLSASLTTTNTNDIIIAYISTTSGSNPYPITISDTAGLTWNLRKSYNPGNLGIPTVDVYYAISTGTLSSDSITASLHLSSFEGLTVFGVSGGNTATPFDNNVGLPSTSTTGAGTATPSVSVSTNNANDFIFGFFTNDQCLTGGTPEMGFTQLQTNPVDYSEYQIVSSTQAGLLVFYTANGTPGGSWTWANLGDAIQKGAQVTQPIKITVDNSGASATFTITNCSPNPTTIVTDGASHNIVADLSCTITITVVADLANLRYRFAGGSTTTTITTCASGTCSLVSLTVYEQLQNTYQATPVGPTIWDAVYSITVKGTQTGTNNLVGCTITTSSGGGATNCQSWFDYNRQVTVLNSFGSWASFPANSNTFTDTTGGNTRNVNYAITNSLLRPSINSNQFNIALILFIIIFLMAVFAIAYKRQR